MSHERQNSLNHICIDDIPYDISNLLSPSKPPPASDGMFQSSSSRWQSYSRLHPRNENDGSTPVKALHSLQRGQHSLPGSRSKLRHQFSHDSMDEFRSNCCDDEDNDSFPSNAEQSRKSSFWRKRARATNDGRTVRFYDQCEKNFHTENSEYGNLPTKENTRQWLRGDRRRADQDREQKLENPFSHELPKNHSQMQQFIEEFSVSSATYSVDMDQSISSTTSDSYSADMDSPVRSLKTSSARPTASCKKDSLREIKSTMVEIFPGVLEPLRGAHQTLAAIESRKTTSIICLCCQDRICCIADAAYVICPKCRVVSSVPHGEWGVGLGFPEDEPQVENNCYDSPSRDFDDDLIRKP